VIFIPQSAASPGKILSTEPGKSSLIICAADLIQVVHVRLAGRFEGLVDGGAVCVWLADRAPNLRERVLVDEGRTLDSSLPTKEPALAIRAPKLLSERFVRGLLPLPPMNA
jgi:hypothetical protein